MKNRLQVFDVLQAERAGKKQGFSRMHLRLFGLSRIDQRRFGPYGHELL